MLTEGEFNKRIGELDGSSHIRETSESPSYYFGYGVACEDIRSVVDEARKEFPNRHTLKKYLKVWINMRARAKIDYFSDIDKWVEKWFGNDKSR